jgi:hypothetical protein
LKRERVQRSDDGRDPEGSLILLAALVPLSSRVLPGRRVHSSVEYLSLHRPKSQHELAIEATFGFHPPQGI